MKFADDCIHVNNSFTAVTPLPLLLAMAALFKKSWPGITFYCNSDMKLALDRMVESDEIGQLAMFRDALLDVIVEDEAVPDTIAIISLAEPRTVMLMIHQITTGFTLPTMDGKRVC